MHHIGSSVKAYGLWLMQNHMSIQRLPWVSELGYIQPGKSWRMRRQGGTAICIVYTLGFLQRSSCQRDKFSISAAMSTQSNNTRVRAWDQTTEKCMNPEKRVPPYHERSRTSCTPFLRYWVGTCDKHTTQDINVDAEDSNQRQTAWRPQYSNDFFAVEIHNRSTILLDFDLTNSS